VEYFSINPEENESSDKIGYYGCPEIAKKGEAGYTNGQNWCR